MSDAIIIGEVPEEYARAGAKTWIATWHEKISRNNITYLVSPPMGRMWGIEVSKTHELGIKLTKALDSDVVEFVDNAILEVYFRHAPLEHLKIMIEDDRRRHIIQGKNEVKGAFAQLMKPEYA